jgi:hypothetical protein
MDQVVLVEVADTTWTANPSEVTFGVPKLATFAKLE